MVSSRAGPLVSYYEANLEAGFLKFCENDRKEKIPACPKFGDARQIDKLL
jgi:hypothetical protein